MFIKRNQKWFRFFYALMRMEVPVSGNETLSGIGLLQIVFIVEFHVFSQIFVLHQGLVVLK